MLLGCLTWPQTAIHGAKMGLLLWFRTLLPTLLPVLIISNILMELCQPLWDTPKIHSSKYRMLAIIITTCFGWFLGLPVGAIITKKIYEKNIISKPCAYLMLIGCNQLSPMFILGYVYPNIPQKGNGILAVYFPLVLIMMLSVVLQTKDAKSHPYMNATEFIAKKTTSRFHLSFQIIDAGIMNGFEIITRLGGYIILFCVLQAFISTIPYLKIQMQAIMVAILEITSGINLIHSQFAPSFQKILLLTIMTSFGGLCTHAQTYGITSDTNLSPGVYTIGKLFCAFFSGIILTLLTLY